MAIEVQTPPPVSPPETPEDDGHELRMSLLDHLLELRNRLIISMIGVLAGTGIGWVFAGDVFKYLLTPYGHPVQILDPTGSVTNYFRVALTMGGIIAIPIITYQVMMFILPGLTQSERRLVLTALPAITLLFLVGVAFAWFIMIPTAFNFLAHFETDIFTIQWTADGYLGFVTKVLFWMGVVFELPLVFYLLARLEMVQSSQLLKSWRGAVVGCSIAAALIAPTADPFTMFLTMFPLLLVYVLSVVLVALAERRRRMKQA